MLQKVTRLDSVPTAEETVLTTEVPTKESRLYTLLGPGRYAMLQCEHINANQRVTKLAKLVYTLRFPNRLCNGLTGSLHILNRSQIVIL